MRWTDLPPDRESADARASALSRGEWDDLRRRLERLPPGHPSRPGDEDDVDEYPAGQEQPDRHDERSGHRERDAGRGAVPGRREPYRPWFTAGESPQPWFAADPGDEGPGP